MTHRLHRGRTPLLISMPHVGTELPDDQRGRYVERAFAFEDTDWHLDRLYAFAADLGAGLIVPRFSRYLIDLNRPPDNQPMYAGQNNTELCPTRFFTGEPLYRDGGAPDAAEVQRRVAGYWRPYHDALAGELQRLRAEHGHAVLFDAHSIKSELPWLFPGTLPHLNLGTAGGASCDASLREAVRSLFEAQAGGLEFVVDGRFKGGYITRHYGRPGQAVHALQLEMAWRSYLDEAMPQRWDDARAAGAAPLLHALVRTLIDWRPR